MVGVELDLDELPRAGRGTLAKYRRAGKAHGKRLADLAMNVAIGAAIDGQDIVGKEFGDVTQAHLGSVAGQLLELGYEKKHIQAFLYSASTEWGRRLVTSVETLTGEKL